MRIRAIDTSDKGDVGRFVRFSFDLYKNDPLWIPPLVASVHHALDRHRHPFYAHSDAQFFLAESGGQVLGRIAALNNRNYNRYHQTKRAYFGYLEVVQDLQVARALLGAAMDWARTQGLDEIIGPRGVLGTDSGGILVEGFDQRPALGVPYNPAYYDDYIRDSGLIKDTDYLSGYVPAHLQISERYLQVAELAKKRRGFEIKTFKSKREMRQWVPRIVHAHRAAFGTTHTYYPPTPDETDLMVKTILSIADPKLVKLVLRDGQVVGFVFVYHDLSQGVKRAGGQLWPLGWAHILWAKRKTTIANANGLGVLPEQRGLGANAIIYSELCKTLQKSQFKWVELIQIEEGNQKSLAEMRNFDVTWHKRHRSYKRAL